MALTFLPTLLFFVLLFSSSLVIAEQHTVQFDNQCGYGTPQLIQGNDVLTTTEYTFESSYSGIAYLQTGDCGFNGESCGIVEMTLINPTVAGGGSSVDISYIPPLAYSVPYKFAFYGGCDGQGASCSSPECLEAFYTPDETYVQVACQTDNVNLLITFCDGNSNSSAITSSAQSTSAAPVTSTAISTFSTQVDTDSTAATFTAVSTLTTSDDATTSLVASSTIAAPSSSSSARRCKNRKRELAAVSQGIRAHRRRSHVSRL